MYDSIAFSVHTWTHIFDSVQGVDALNLAKMSPSKAKLDGNDNTTLLCHHYILCHFANYADHKTIYMHLAYSLYEQGSQHYSLHSLTRKRQQISTMFNTNKNFTT